MPLVSTLEADFRLADGANQLGLVLVDSAKHLATPGLRAPAHQRVLIILLLLLEALVFRA